MTASLDNSYIKWPSADIDALLTVQPGEDFALYLVYKLPSTTTATGILFARIPTTPGDDWGVQFYYHPEAKNVLVSVGGSGWFELTAPQTPDVVHAMLVSFDRDGQARAALDGPNWGYYSHDISGSVNKALGAGRDLTIGADHNGATKFTGPIAEAAMWRGTCLDALADRQALMSGGAPHRGKPLSVQRDKLVFCTDLRQADALGKAIDLITGKAGTLVGDVELSEDAGEMFSHHQELYLLAADQALDETRPTLVTGAGDSAAVPASLEVGRRHKVVHVGETRFGRRSSAVETDVLLIGDESGHPQLLPRRPQSLRAELGAGGNVTLHWTDSALVPGADPADFAIYGNGGDGPVDLSTPIATESWVSAKSYFKDLGALAADSRWAFVVRARASGGTVTDGNLDLITCTPRSAGVGQQTELISVQVTGSDPVWTEPDSA